MSFHYGDQVHGDKVGGDKYTYHGPVAGRDGQFAWANQHAAQTSNHAEVVAPGYADLADALQEVLSGIDHIGLSAEDRRDARVAADGALEEIRQAPPDRSVVRRALTALKGLLAPIATGLSGGGSDGVKDWAKSMVEQLTSLMPLR